uniref:MYND-type domain-containing protein n=1 Tax=Tetradesmus obliquus TaxID=3088 RepID=A0A383VLF2_TETOB|eukprot:jgi/Sobl393_1/4182/SZX65572.1
MPRKRQEQQREQMLQSLEAAARRLHALLQSQPASQLLQQPPPAAAADLTHQQQDLLTSSDMLLQALLETHKQLHAAAAAPAPGRALGLVLRQQAARSAGTLLVWLQQRPERLRFDLMQQMLLSGADADAAITAVLWMRACAWLDIMAQGLAIAEQAPQPGCSVAALAAAILQQLEQSGLLSSMPASTVPLMQAIRKQWSSTAEDWTPYHSVIVTVRALMCVTDVSCRWARALVPAALQHAALQATAQLMQQLHGCATQLPAATAGAGGSSSSSSSSSSPHAEYIEAQIAAMGVICRLYGLVQEQQLSADSTLQAEQLLEDPAVQWLLLQPLVAFVVLLHLHHAARKQQQQQQQQRRPGTTLQLLPIPAFHQDMPLPGGQAYLDAAAAMMQVDYSRLQDSDAHNTWSEASLAVAMLDAGLEAWSMCGVRDQACSNVMLSAAAVRLVLELQLLAADAVQQQQQQQQTRPEPLHLLANCNNLLATQLRLSMQITGGGCLPPEVLQQAGLQLLQALAAPLQLLKVLNADRHAVSSEELSAMLGSSQQLYALRAAVEGAAATDDGVPAAVQHGRLTALAAAHPEAYTALIDCCMRSEQLQPADMLAAADLLAPAIRALLVSDTALANTAAVAGLASALTSLAKRAVQFIRAAASMQQEQPPAAEAEVEAAAYFVALAPTLVKRLFILPFLDGKEALVGTSSSSSSSQVHASCALLAVVLARSIVQLADAMEAAGPQLLFDSLVVSPGFYERWAPTEANDAEVAMVVVPMRLIDEGEHSMNAEWHWREVWQPNVLCAINSVCSFLDRHSTPAAAAAAAATGVCSAAGCASTDGASGRRTATSAAGDTASSSSISAHAQLSSSSSSSSSGSSQQVQWRYLLDLQQLSPRWAAAVAEYRVIFEALDQQAGEDPAVIAPLAQQLGTGGGVAGLATTIISNAHIEQQYAAALELCRALAAAAPLPVVCNNPGCDSLDGLSEAAAASKACAGCRCRYCSAACQTADWRRHKRACRLLAAAGQACV